jgi:IS5 family transposase
LLPGLLLQMLYSIRSERLLMEELDYNILYRWFVGLSLDDAVWDATTFTKNRDRLLAGDVADGSFTTVDGTLLEAWASHESFKLRGTAGKPPDDPKNPTVSFHGERRPNDTHQSTTDPEARLFKKAVGREAKLGYLGHLLTENRHGLIVDTALTAATGTAERDAAILMLGELPLTSGRVTVGADKLYDTRDWIDAVRAMGVTPHVAQNSGRPGGSAIDGRTVRHVGYVINQRRRKLVEQAFAWMKTIGLLRTLRHCGGRLVDWIFAFGAAAYNLVRWRNLVAQPA